jgi:bla regulator protein blaR1
MSELLAEMNRTAASGLAALLNTMWYAGAVVALTWVGLRYCPRVNAATRHWIWTAVLGFLLVLPFLPGLAAHARTLLAMRSQAASNAPLATIAAHPAAVQQTAPVMLTVNTSPGSNPWPLWLLAAWIVAAGWQLTRLVMGVASVRRLKARAKVAPTDTLAMFPCPTVMLSEAKHPSISLQANTAILRSAQDDSSAAFSALCGYAAIGRKLRLLTSAEIASPVAVGYRHPAVVVPPGLLERLEEGERQSVLLHELAHLARYDDWMALVTRALRALLVLHPLGAIVLGRIEREREMACDDFVVARTGAARSYARSLARLHDLRWSAGARLLAPGILGRNSSLGDRIESLLRRGRVFSARPSLASLGISAVLLAMLVGAGGLIPGWIAIAQTTLPKSFYADLPKSLEVASIRPAKPGRGSHSHGSNGRLWATIPISELIERAYQIMPQQLEGLPSWARSARYTIQAEAPPGMAKDYALARTLPPEQRPQAIAALRQSWSDMLQSLLIDRFKLKVHRETKRLPVYELLVAKGGPKLKPTKKPTGSSDNGWRGHLVEAGASMDNFASVLSQYGPQRELGRIVINKTGLTGRYDFTLTWTPLADKINGMSAGAEPGGNAEPAPGMAPAPGSSDSSNPSAPSIFTALQQELGLKLKAAKGPVEVLVVDHIDPPTPN